MPDFADVLARLDALDVTEPDPIHVEFDLTRAELVALAVLLMSATYHPDPLSARLATSLLTRVHASACATT